MLGIESVGRYLPPARLSNYQRKEQFGIDDDFIEAKIGIKQVSRKKANEETSDLCLKAFEDLQSRSGVKTEDIEAMVVVTQTPDFSIPHVSAIVHGRLGLREDCACFDVSLGCSGWVYSLSVLHSFMTANNLKKGVLITCDPYSKVVSDEDKNTTLLFGDAAAATLIGENPVFVPGIFTFGSKGSDWDKLTTKDGQLYMNGRAVFNFAAKQIPADLRLMLDKNKTDIDQVDRFLLHQGSKIIVQTIANKLGVDQSRVPFSVSDYGNSCGSTIPLLLIDEFDNPEANLLACSGFGVGLSWASTLLRRV